MRRASIEARSRAGVAIASLKLEGTLASCLVVLTVAGCVASTMTSVAYVSPFTGGALLVAFGATAIIVAHYGLFAPMRRLATVAETIGSGDYDGPIVPSRRDEIGRLELAIDTLRDRLHAARLSSAAQIEALDQLRHADRIATLGQLAATVAHELGNPLNVIELRARLIISDRAIEHAREHAGEIVEQTRRMTRIVEEVLAFVRVRPVRIASLDLVAVLRKAVALAEHTSRKHATSIALDVPATALEVTADADQLLQIVVNLVTNGVQAMPGGGTLRIRASEHVRSPIDDPDGAPRPYVCIQVMDHGTGIPDELVTKIFQPFFSTKSLSGGTGLGLSVAQHIAREHEGWISVDTGLDRGSTFNVHLPKHGPRGMRDRHGS